MIGGLFGIDELGRNRTTNENVIVSEIVAMKQGAKYRVVKGLCQFRLQVIADQLHVLALDVKPELAVEGFQVEQFLQVANRILDANIVELDALARSRALGLPVGVFEAFLGALGDLAENREMAIETLQDGGGNLRRKPFDRNVHQ